MLRYSSSFSWAILGSGRLLLPVSLTVAPVSEDLRCWFFTHRLAGGGSTERVSGGRGEGPGDLVHGQAHVVLGEARRRGPRRRHVVELGELHTVLELVFVVEAVQHGRHPPGEALHPP